MSGATIYGGRVYLFSYDSEKGDWTFLTMDADGTNRKKIETLSASDFSCDAVGLNAVWYENDAVVFVVQCESWEEASRYYALGKINLSDGKLSVLATLNESDTSVLGYEDGVFFFECGVWDESPLTEEEFYAENDTGDYETYYSEAYASYFNQKYFFLQLNDTREEMLANSYLNIETSEVTDLNGRISGGGWIFGSSENFFVGNGKNGSICILKEDYYASAFKKAVVMDKDQT